MSTLGSRLREAREKKGWSQTYVCNKLGISNSTLSGYERNYREPDAEMITTFANLYEVQPGWIVSGIDPLREAWGNRKTGEDKLKEARLPYLIENEKNEVLEDPDIQFILRARKDLSPEAYAQFMKAAKKMKQAFEEEEDD